MYTKEEQLKKVKKKKVSIFGKKNILKKKFILKDRVLNLNKNR